MPDDEGSVTRWLGGAKAGDEAAARELWRRYFETLVRLARARLRASPRAAEDEEDVALTRLRQLPGRCGARPIPPARRPGRPVAHSS